MVNIETMPAAEEELAQIKAKMDKIQTKQYEEYAEKIKTQLVNKDRAELKKTQRNLLKRRNALTLKLGGRRTEDNKKKLHKGDFLIKSIDDVLIKDEVNTSSEGESEDNEKILDNWLFQIGTYNLLFVLTASYFEKKAW